MPAGKKSIFGHFDIHALSYQPDSCSIDRSAGDRAEHFEIAWFTGGSGFLQVDEQIYEIDPDSLYFLAPGCLSRRDQRTALRGYHMSFSLEFLYVNGIQHGITRWLESQAVKVQVPVLRNETDTRGRIGQIILEINREFNDNTDMSSDIISGLLSILLMYLKRKAGDIYNPATTETQMVRDFLTSVKRQFTNKRMVYDYAIELSVTPNYLNRIVKRLTGTTASDHIQQQIVLEAKRQVIQCNASMKEVAYNLGFDNLAHFSRFFKNKCGQSYSAFKKNLTHFPPLPL
jgi:AraC-like DNA-binding protein